MTFRNLSSKIACIFLAAYGLSCTPTLDLSDDELAEVIEMEKTPCYQQCPVFKMTLYENGIVKYEGESYVDKEGLWSKKMNINDLRKLAKKFRDSNFFELEDVYRSEIPDQQTVTITFHDNGSSKTVIGKADGRPDIVLELQAQLDEIADSPEGWKEVFTEENPNMLSDGTITNEIVVQLVNGINVDDWINRYAQSEARLVESLSSSGRYWLITFNSSSIDPDLLLENIRNDPDVIGAEFNMQLDGR